MKATMVKVENSFKKAAEMLQKMKSAARSDRQKTAYEKLSEKIQREKDAYNRLKPKYEYVANDKNAVSQAKIGGGIDRNSMVGSDSFADRDSDIPVMKAYDQTDLITKRQENIQKLNK
jgi:hypothetical protein